MKIVTDKIIKNIHLFLLLNTGVTVFQNYEEISVQLQDIDAAIKTIDIKIDAQIRKNRKINEFQRDLESSRQRIAEVSKQIELVQRQLPNTILDTEILEYFSKETNELNLKDIYLSPLKEENKDFYFSKQYELKAIGTFLQFMIFFEKISQNDRLFNIKSMILSNKVDGVKAKGRFQIVDMKAVMEAFRYNPDYSKNLTLETEVKE